MIHPEALLADYVDGTLSSQERVEVTAHLEGCAKCAREVALASHARSALNALEVVPAPPGVGSKAIEEAARARTAAGVGGPPSWYRVGGIVGAVAAGLLIVTLVLPHIGQSGTPSEVGRAAAASGEDGASKTLTAASGIEIQHQNYDNASLTALISSYAAADSLAGGAEAATAPPAPTSGRQAQVDKALACIVRSAPAESGDIQRLIRARFEGTPAYLALFTEGPGAGQPADTVTIWVFAADDCRILSFSSAQR